MIPMSSPSSCQGSPDLVGYALRILEEEEHLQVEGIVQRDGKTRAMLQKVHKLRSPLEADKRVIRAPSGLARKTILHVRTTITRTLPAAPPLSRDSGERYRTWGLRTDLIAAAGLLILFGGVLWPAIHRQRQTQADLACRYNLSQNWRGLVHWAMNHGGNFPVPEEKGPRSTPSIFAFAVIQSGYVNPQSFFLDCPSLVEKPKNHQVPSFDGLDDLYMHDRPRWKEVVTDLGGSYAYHMGHRHYGRHVGYDLRSGDHRPIMADAGPAQAGHNSPNHLGTGQNVLTIGGNVSFWKTRNAGIGRDDIYLNERYAHRAGLHRNDTVLGCSTDRPCDLAD